MFQYRCFPKTNFYLINAIYYLIRSFVVATSQKKNEIKKLSKQQRYFFITFAKKIKV